MTEKNQGPGHVDPKKKRMIQVANVVFVAFNLITNYAKGDNGETFRKIAAQHPFRLFPDDYAFAIWIPIFALSVVYAIY